MTKPLPIGTIVRVIPGKEHDFGAKLINNGLYPIYRSVSLTGTDS